MSTVHTWLPWAAVLAFLGAWPWLPNGIPGKNEALVRIPRPDVFETIKRLDARIEAEPDRPVIVLMGDSRMNHALRGIEDWAPERCVELGLSPCPLIGRLMVPAGRMSDYARVLNAVADTKPQQVWVQVELAFSRPNRGNGVFIPERMRTTPRGGPQRTEADLAHLQNKWDTEYTPDPRDLGALRRLRKTLPDHNVQLLSLPRGPTSLATMPQAYRDSLAADVARLERDHGLTHLVLDGDAVWTDEHFYDYTHMNAAGTEQMRTSGAFDRVLQP